MKENFVKRLAANINKNKTISASTLVGKNPEVAAVVSKLINPRNTGDRTLYDARNLSTTLNTNKIGAISNSISSRYRNNKNILQLFPDLELAMQILISSILSPKDMVKVELIYKTNETVFPLELNAQLIELVRRHMTSSYNLEDDLSKILEDSLFLKGASVKAVLPESLIDGIINNKLTPATEAINEIFSRDSKNKISGIKGLGFLGGYSNRAKVSLESYSNTPSVSLENGLYINPETPKLIDKYVEISDNFKFLKLPMAKKVLRSSMIKGMFGTTSLSQEDIRSYADNTVLFKTIRDNTKLVEIIPDSTNLPRKSVGKPLILNLPSESVIPVSLPNDPEDHLGYFIVLDENGSPVTTLDEDMYHLQSIFNNKGNQDNLSSHLLNKAQANINGGDASDNLKLDNVVQIYSSLVEDNLKRRLMNGAYDESLIIANNEEIYKIMLARSLANRYTKVIYIPSEFITYFSFDYYENGVGKSLLDNLKVITSIRAVLMFARVMAHLKSSINLTTVNLTLDEDDPDPQRTVEIAVHEVMRMRQQYFPLGVNSPSDLVDWVQRAGVQFSFEGHPGIPNTKFDFDVKNVQHTLPETDFEDELRKQTYMALGLSPETVDNGFNPEFATTIVSNNILLSKRVMIYQNKYTKMLLDYIKKILTFDNTIRDEIKDLIETNIENMTKFVRDEDKDLYANNKVAYINKLVDQFIDILEIGLPKPDETTLDNQVEAFDKYNEAIDKVIDSWISSELTNDSLSGNISTYVDVIKPIVKAYYVRRWMSENNFLPELADLVTSDDEGNPNIDLYDISKSHITSLMKSMFKLVQSMQENKKVMDSNLEVIGAEEPEQQPEEQSGNDQGSDDMGDFDFGNETGGGEEQVDGETPPEEEEEPDTKEPPPEETPDEKENNNKEPTGE